MRRRAELQQKVEAAAALTEASYELEILTEMAREGDAGVDDELKTALGRIVPELDRFELTA